MIITRTPLRVSFVGGGTDLAAFYWQEPGAVVTTAIRKYIYITVNRKFDSSIRASYSVTEMVDSVGEVQHELIRESLRKLRLDGGIEITSISDIPSQGTGLGSSSSYTVGLLKALYAHCNQHVGAERLAREACEIEIDSLRKPIGKQDQYIAAYGGLQYFRFNPDGSVFVEPIMCSSATRQALENAGAAVLHGHHAVGESHPRRAAAESDERPPAPRTAAAGAARRRAAPGAGGGTTSRPSARFCTKAGSSRRRWPTASAAGRSTTGTSARAPTARSAARSPAPAAEGFCCSTLRPTATPPSCSALPELRRVSFGFEPQGSTIIYVEESEGA